MESYSDSDITIRPLQISDANDFMQWYSDENVSKFCSWDAFTSKEAAIEYVAENVINHPYHKAICLSGRPVGYVMVTRFQGNDRCRAEIGCGVASAYWGKGIATRAVKMAAREVFEEWRDLERVEALVEVENVASQRVMEKAGFEREGVLRKYWIMKGKARDFVMFSILGSDIKR